MKSRTAVAALLLVGATFAAAVPVVATPSDRLDEDVAISPSRFLHIECEGEGTPTVVLLAGGYNSGAI